MTRFILKQCCLISVFLSLCCADLTFAGWQQAASSVFRLSHNGKTIGTAFLYRHSDGIKQTHFFATAGHVLEQVPSNTPIVLDLAEDHNDATLRKVMQGIIPLLRKEDISVSEGSDPLDILRLPVQDLYDKLSMSKTFVPSVQLSRLSLKMKLIQARQQESGTEDEKTTLMKLNRLLLQERFPKIATDRPTALIRERIILSRQDDVGIFWLEDATAIDTVGTDGLNSYRNGIGKETVGRQALAWHFSFFPPIFSDAKLPARGHILQYNAKTMRVYLAPMNEGSSGSPVLDENGNLMGMVLNQINARRNDVNTSIYEAIPINRLNELIESYLAREFNHSDENRKPERRK